MAPKQGKSAKRARPLKHGAPKNAFKKQNKNTKHRNAKLRDELDVDARSLHATVECVLHIIQHTTDLKTGVSHGTETSTCYFSNATNASSIYSCSFYSISSGTIRRSLYIS